VVVGRLDGKVAIVTGASGGIGSRVAARFADEGARLVLAARSTDRLNQLAAGLAEAAVAPGDLTKPKTAERLVARALEEFGRLDVLVNNAGLDHADDLLETPLADVRTLFEVNVFGAIVMLQAAARAMRDASGGAIINVTSRLATVGVPRMGLYGAAKGALLSLTRAAAVELAPYNIRVNAVAPGMTRTPLYEAWLADQADPRRTEEGVVSEIPQGRLADPEDVAAAIAFLASDDAAHITGASLAVDGGYTAR
jgi:NAD(P)-dependent dehydrogenase (short-subunit alcohol dehydrogenase family)